MDVLQALRSLEGGEPFDCIFMDAPYEQHLEQPVLEYLADSTLADENTLIVVEEDLHTDFSYVEDLDIIWYVPRNIKPTSMFS